MKILLVAPQPYYVERGTPIAVRQLATTLAAQGHEVFLLTYPFGDDPGDPGVTVLRCLRLPGIKHIPIGFSLAKLVYDVPLSFSIWRAYFKYDIDVVHANEEAIYPALMLKLARAKVVYDMDSSLADQMVAAKPKLSFMRRLLERFESLAIRRSDAVAAVCDELADQARVVTAPERVHTLYDVPNEASGEAGDAPAVDDLSRHVGPDERIGLYIGNLETYQGIDLLLDAIKLLPEGTPLKTLIVGGSAEHIEAYRAKAASMGIGERITFLGPRPLEHLSALLEQAFVLFSPRITGGNTPMKLYSYMASGRPVVATRLSTHTQVLDDDTAMLPAAEAAPYAESIAALIDDPGRADRLGAAARELVAQKYSRARFAESVDALYAQLAGA